MNVIELLKKAIKESRTLTIRTTVEDYFSADAGSWKTMSNVRLSTWLMHMGQDIQIWEFDNGTIIHVGIDDIDRGRSRIEIYELTDGIVEEVQIDREIADGIVVEDGEDVYRPAANYKEVLDYMGNGYNEWVVEVDPLMFGLECELDEPYTGPKILKYATVPSNDYGEDMSHDD